MADSTLRSLPRRAVFLDRDGVINSKLPEDHYVSDIDELKLIPSAIEALSVLRRLGYVLVLITNQRGIARGLMTEEDLAEVHEHMQRVLQSGGAALDAIYHCPHEVFEDCACRKPRPGMILAAVSDLNLDPSKSYTVGDSDSDVAAGKSAGTKTVRIGAGTDNEADLTFPDLLQFALFLQRREKESN